LDKLRTPVHGVAGAVSRQRGSRTPNWPVPVFVYAAVFVLVNLAYIPFEWHALLRLQGGDSAGRDGSQKARFVSDIGNLHCCDASVAKVSLAGLWIDLLRFAGLSAARTPGVW